MYVTYCSKDKAVDPKPLPPGRRYVDPRIWYVLKLAREAGEPAAILSGEFGLVSTDQCIPLYDHLLTPEETAEMSEKVAKQLKGQSSVTFFIDSGEFSARGPALTYVRVMQEACKKAGASFAMRPVPGNLELNPSDITVGDISMNKKSFILSAQDEAGLWKVVRKSSFLPDLQIKARALAKKFPERKVSIKEEQNFDEFSF